MDETRAFELLREIAFTRMSGTPEELKAAEIFAREAEAIGVEHEIEPFTVYDGEVERAELEVLEPFHARYEVTGMRRSLDTGDEGIEAELVYVENALEANLVGVKDKIVLFNGYLNYDPYERIRKAGAKGVIAFSGSILDDPAEMEIALRMLRPKMTDAFGDTYAVNMRAADAMDMVRRGATRVRMVVRSRKVELTSHNVYATIPGTVCPDEIVSLGAHYDSTEYSKGVYDNGSGSVILVELMRYFKQHPPRRTLKFMWFGSEEVGLCGSTYFCQAHKDELERHRVMINVDMAAPVLGYEICIAMGDEALEHYADCMMRENGLPYVLGRTWTTDALFRETEGNMAKRKAEGCISVEMESAGVQAMCTYRGLQLYAFFTSGDLLDAPKWDARMKEGQVRHTQHDPGHFEIALALAQYVSER